MHLLLRRNYLVLEVDQHSDEYVAVQTLTGEKSHERWLGFSSVNSSHAPVLIPCNGWRKSPIEDWVYLEMGEYVAGAHTGLGIVAFRTESGPVIVTK